MTFNEYKKMLPKNLSIVKEKILKRLWEEGDKFPKGWVKSSELLSITKQKYFDRRTRELRDEMGCDIETKIIEAEHSYRLNSPKINISNPRHYLPNNQKEILFEKNNFTCSVCGKKYKKEEKGLQSDHKIPLMRGGTNEESNWQPLCVECNVIKRRACAGCKLDCKTCSWAFPEKISARTLIQLPPKLNQYLYEHCKNENQTLSEFVAEAIEQYKTKNED